MRQIRSAPLLFAFLALTLAGCGNQGRKPVFPATGKVLFEGSPAEHATVIFHPVGESGPEVVKPRGKVGKDGTFQLTTYEANDGAPTGNYLVTVEWWLSSGRDGDAPKNRLPARYARGETSGLEARIESGKNEIRPFQLKR